MDYAQFRANTAKRFARVVTNSMKNILDDLAEDDKRAAIGFLVELSIGISAIVLSEFYDIRAGDKEVHESVIKTFDRVVAAGETLEQLTGRDN